MKTICGAQLVEVAWLATERQVSGLADSVPGARKVIKKTENQKQRLRPALTGVLPAGEFSETGRQQLDAFSKSAALYIVVALPPWVIR